MSRISSVSRNSKSRAADNADFDSRLPAGREMFTVRWIAGYLDVSVNHVNNLIDSGAIRIAIDVRGTNVSKAMRRVPRAALVEFLNGREGQ